jgi:3-deoxy-7-phosphoheptulonate synthase
VISHSHNRRIASSRPLSSPRQVRGELPLEAELGALVERARDDAKCILREGDDRLLVIVGPCSIHDPDAGLDYAARLAEADSVLGNELVIVMRCYFEKPRTTLGWKGLINDPGLDGTYRMNDGIRAARSFLLDVLRLGLPAGCEFLDPIIPQYLADLVSWGSIGARTAQSQIHRQLASGLSMPVGIKNSPEGDVKAAVDAAAASGAPHVFPGVDDDGRAAVFTTVGNDDCHVVLRGAATGPNHGAATVARTRRLLEDAGVRPTLLVDASHGNSGKEPAVQMEVITELAQRLADGERGIVGVMIESFIERGRQELDLGRPALRYGMSVTDPCMSWDDTVVVLNSLASAVAARRATRSGVRIDEALARP